MKKTIIIHPLFFAVYPVLFLYAHNIGYVLLNEVLILIAVTVIFSLLLFLLLNFILKSKEKAGLITSLFLLLFFSYGHFTNAIGDFRFTTGRIIIGPNKILFPVVIVFFILGVYFSIKTRRNLHNFTNLLNVVAGSMIVISLINIGAYRSKTKVAWQNNRSMEKRKAVTIDSTEADTFPDIYYIILDGYASSSTLKEIYGYDNQEFIDYLNDKGFYVATKSRTNYMYTFLSLASSLNMEYINELNDTVMAESECCRIASQMIKDNKVMRFLRKREYKFVNFRSGCSLTDYNRYADRNIHCGRLDEFLMVLIRTTMLRAFESHFIGPARGRVLRIFSQLAEVQHSIKGPKFVFAHILAPHPPYLFGPNGEPVKDIELKMAPEAWEDKQLYLDQLIFVNKKVKELIEEILSETEIPPIIILQSDHGPGYIWGRMLKIGIEEQLGEKMLKERMEILNAYYLPDNAKNFLYDSITPVNTFRLIFNCLFNTRYDLLNDKSYFSHIKRRCKFIDVTDKIK